MIHSEYGTPEEMRAQAKKKNDEELDKFCKICCLVIGWLSVLSLFIFICYMIVNGPSH